MQGHMQKTVNTSANEIYVVKGNYITFYNFNEMEKCNVNKIHIKNINEIRNLTTIFNEARQSGATFLSGTVGEDTVKLLQSACKQ